MLPGNINDRIVTLANKHAGFEGRLFSKTGQIEGENRKLTTDEHRWTQIFEQQRREDAKGLK